MAALTFTEYQKAAARTAGKHGNLYEALSIWALGVAGEAGEVADLIKKVVGHGHPLDATTQAKLRKELGDVHWYLAAMATAMGWDLGDIAQENIEKLRKRYPEGFDPDRSLKREGE